MLNLNYKTVYQYKKNEKQQLKELREKYGRKYQKVYGKSKKRVWYDGEVKTTKIKHNIIKRLLTESRFRCAYCCKMLVRSEKPLDHFIPNSEHPFLSFHPLNLIPSCGYCNSSLKKTFNPLISKESKYSKNIFSIVHPIIDDVDSHIFYINPERTLLDISKCTIQGLLTIELFELHLFEMLQERINQHLINQHNPLSNDALIRLVNECATYQPR